MRKSETVVNKEIDTPKLSRLFQYIEELQGEASWGSMLDAGTGTNSISWIASLDTEKWTAITGAAAHAIEVRDKVGQAKRPQDRIILANWTDPDLLKGEVYDTVLADYLLGAIDGFAPYFQPELFHRLRQVTRKQLYFVGLEPYVTDEPESVDGKLVWRIGRYRDACLLLAGEMPYREYPSGWVADHMKLAGFKITAMRPFSIYYTAGFVHGQIDMCVPRLEKLADRKLAGRLLEYGKRLREEALSVMQKQDGKLRHGQDYVIAAVPV